MHVLIGWKMQLVLFSLYLIFSIVWTSSNKVGFAIVVKCEITFLLAESELQSLTPQFNCPGHWENAYEKGKVFPIKKNVYMINF